MLTIACIIILSVMLAALATQPFVRVVSSQPPQVDPARLEAHVRHLSVDFYPRSFDQPRKMELAAEYIINEFKNAGATVSVQEITVEEARYKNIIVRFGPQSGPLLVIGAHYDSYSEANSGAVLRRGYSPDTHTPGADDNASGVAALIELAGLLSREPQARPIELVAYAVEEPPHFRTDDMGSVWHARSLKLAKKNVQLMISLEMIGYFSDKLGSQSYPIPGMTLIYPARGNFIALVGKFSDFSLMRSIKGLMSGATDLPVFSINAPAIVPGIDFSDHRSYWKEHIPALMITDTAFFRNRSYHDAGDTYDTLDYTRMAKVVQSVYAVTQKF